MTFFFSSKAKKELQNVAVLKHFLIILFFIALAVPTTLFANPKSDDGKRSEMKRVAASSEGVNVIEAYSSRQSMWRGKNGKGIKSRKIEINPEITQNLKYGKNKRLFLQLFEDVHIDAMVKNSTTDINGTNLTTAKIEGSDWGRVFIATADGKVSAKIHVPEQRKFYAIQHNSIDGNHYALELDPEKVQYDEICVPTPEETVMPNNSWRLPEVTHDQLKSGDTIIDIMVVYSNDALFDVGGLSGMNNLIGLGMAYANDAHSNSNSGIHLNLIYSGLVDYDGTNNRRTDLDHLTSMDDGVLDEVHTLRDNYGADFVVLLVGNYSSDGGIAWVLQSTEGRPSYAFSVITEPAFDSYTPVHEIGHNMGLSHAKDQNFQPGPTSWRSDPFGFGDSTAGWHWHPTPNARGYSSIMAYTGGSYFPDGLSHTRVGIFSDPNKYDHSLPSGHIADGNSIKVLRALKNVYAGYRDRANDSANMTCFPARNKMGGISLICF